MNIHFIWDKMLDKGELCRCMNMAKVIMNSLPAELTPEEIFDDDCPEMTNGIYR